MWAVRQRPQESTQPVPSADPPVGLVAAVRDDAAHLSRELFDPGQYGGRLLAGGAAGGCRVVARRSARSRSSGRREPGLHSTASKACKPQPRQGLPSAANYGNIRHDAIAG